MRAKSMVLLLIALGCGLVASIGISQVMERGSNEAPTAEVETTEVFVATVDINISDRLDASNVKLEEWPVDKVPGGAVRNFVDLEGRYAGSRLFAGEPIVAKRLLDRDTSHATTIPDGYRVTSVKVTLDTAVAGLIRPGDRVDVIGFFRRNQDIPVTSTRAVLRNVRVFAVDSDTTRETDPEGRTINVRTISLLVKEEQVEPLMLAMQLGNLRLSLRRPDDGMADIGPGMADVQMLFSDVNRLADDKPAGPPQPSADLLAFLEDASQRVDGHGEGEHQMVVYSPRGVEVFNWSDRTQLPDNLAPSGGKKTGERKSQESEARPEEVEVDANDAEKDERAIQSPRDTPGKV